MCELTGGRRGRVLSLDITTLAGSLVGIPSQLSLGGRGGTEGGIARGPQSRLPRPADRRARHKGTSLVAGRCAAVLGLLSGPILRKGSSQGSLITSPTGFLLCYPGGGTFTLATGVNLNLETNHKGLGRGEDVIGVQMG